MENHSTLKEQDNEHQSQACVYTEPIQNCEGQGKEGSPDQLALGQKHLQAALPSNHPGGSDLYTFVIQHLSKGRATWLSNFSSYWMELQPVFTFCTYLGFQMNKIWEGLNP